MEARDLILSKFVYPLQRGQLRTFDLSLGFSDIRNKFSDDAKVIRRLEFGGSNEHLTCYFVESICQLLRLVGWVNIYKNEIGEGRC